MPDTTAPLIELTLESFPVTLFAAADEQWAGMLREYELRSFGTAQQTYGADDIAQAARALRTVNAALVAHARPAGLAALPDRVRLPLTVGGRSPGDFATLQAVLEDARRLAVAGQLLVLPTLPEVAALRDWLCEEVAAQLAGAPPTPWEFEAALRVKRPVGPAELDDGIVPSTDVAWIVGDEHNRIVAASPAAYALLGWSDGELVGQRLLVVIPPHLRERHVAGFTRSVVTGDERLLGVPLELPALARDGREIPIVLTLTRHASGAGNVYLGTLQER
jgi:PAS domain S-box-containing protein